MIKYYIDKQEVESKEFKLDYLNTRYRVESEGNLLLPIVVLMARTTVPGPSDNFFDSLAEMVFNLDFENMVVRNVASREYSIEQVEDEQHEQHEPHG